MSTPTPPTPATIPVGTTIYPYATPTGIIQLVPLESLEQAIQERDLARERGFETADVLTATERERDRLKAKIENQKKELNRFNSEITSLQRREGKMRDEMRRMKIYESIVLSVRKILRAENEEKTDDAAKRVIAELANLTRRLQAAEHINEGYRAMEQRLEEARDAVAELNQRLIERTQDMLSKQTELIQEARKARSVARRALDFLDGVAQIFQVCADDRRFKPSDRSNMQKCADGVRAEAKPLRAELEAFDALPVRPNAAECGQCADKATFHLAPGEG